MPINQNLRAISQKSHQNPRRLVLLFDGTWNKREDTTNIWRMKIMLRDTAMQCIYYDEGVGTAKGEKIKGGAFGSGLSSKVLAAYLWLMEHFEDSTESEIGCTDEIFVFGFSRGAYTARSLVGLLSISGLLHRDASKRVLDAFEFSRIEGLQENSPLAIDFRQRFSRSVRVKFLGVWDTVGALGIPRLKGIPQMKFPALEDNAYHKVTELPSIVDHARHAVAIDEYRYIFEATLWPQCGPGQTMEQRWFTGAHANVGGGYGNDGLFRRPLQWMQEESCAFGLEYRQRITMLGDNFYNSAPRDPLDEVAYGLYNLTQWLRPYNRIIDLGKSSIQSIDYTVLERWIWNPYYRPGPLVKIKLQKPIQFPPIPPLTNNQINHLMPQHTLTVNSTRGYTQIL